MELKRKVNTGGERKLYTGFFLGTPRLVNPSNETLAETLGFDLDPAKEETKYEGTTKKNDEYVSVNFWLQTPENQWFQVKNMLINNPVIFTETKKQQFVNQVLGVYPIDEEKNLPEWFTQFQEEKPAKSKNYINLRPKEYRAAIQGEGNLYAFLSAWLTHVNYYFAGDADNNPTNVWIKDTKRAFRNIEKFVREEYQQHLDIQAKWDKETNAVEKKRIGAEEKYTEPVICLATVKIEDTADGAKEYQQVWNNFLPGYLWSKLKICLNTGNFKNADKKIEKYYELLNSKNKPKDAFSISLLKEFDPSEHLGATDETFVDGTVIIKSNGTAAPVTDLSY